MLQILGMSYFFYEVNRAGRLPPNTRAPWRADTLKKSAGGSLDGQWEGGYFDAGDHNIFQLPQAYSIARLIWILHAFPKALKQTYFDVRSDVPDTGHLQ
jgi:endoglucanase